MLGHSAGRGVDGSLDWLCGLIDTHTDLSLIGEGLDGRIVLWSEGAQQTYGYSYDDAVGKDTTRFLQSRSSPNHPGGMASKPDPDRGDVWKARLWRVRQSGEQCPVEVLRCLWDGEDGRAVGYIELSRVVPELACDGGPPHPDQEPAGEGTARFQSYARRLLEVQEAERRLIARELHDEVGQNLTFLKISLGRVAQQAARTNTPFAGPLDECVETVDQTLHQIRGLLTGLRPPLLDAAGLIPALRWLLDRQTRGTGLQHSFTADASDARLSGDLELVCYRIVQEALTNAIRHAQARRVTVRLRVTHRVVRLTVSDDGVGFDVAAARRRAAHGESLGLVGMEERVRLAGGELEVTSRPNRGTNIDVRFPLDQEPAGRGEAG